MRQKLGLLLATVFGVGYAPVASGTWGTLVALPLAWLASGWSGGAQLALLAGVTLVGIWAAHEAGQALGVVDARQIVVDEVAGLLVTTLWLPLTVPSLVAAFVLFRLFDILKPWPASYFDRKVKNGAGVVLDDLCAGVYARATLALLAWGFPSLAAGGIGG